MINMLRTRRQVKEARSLPFAEAARRFRKAIYTGELLHPRVMLALAERCEQTTPREQRGTWQRYAASMRAGRRIKTMTGMITAVDSVPVEMIDEINEAAEGVE